MSFQNWLTRGDVAQTLSISGEYVRILGRNGLLDFVETPLGKLYNPESVEIARANRIGKMRKRAAGAR